MLVFFWRGNLQFPGTFSSAGCLESAGSLCLVLPARTSRSFLLCSALPIYLLFWKSLANITYSSQIKTNNTFLLTSRSKHWTLPFGNSLIPSARCTSPSMSAFSGYKIHFLSQFTRVISRDRPSIAPRYPWALYVAPTLKRIYSASVWLDSLTGIYSLPVFHPVQLFFSATCKSQWECNY